MEIKPDMGYEKSNTATAEVNSTVGKVDHSPNAPVAEAVQESSGDPRQIRNLADVLDAENSRNEEADVTADTPGVAGHRERRRTLPVRYKDTVVPKKTGRASWQRRSTYGTEFPCMQCSKSYQRYDTLRSHVYQVHGGKNLMPKKNYGAKKEKNTITSNIGSFDCAYCTASFITKEARFKHTMSCHQEDLVAENDLPNAREEEPTSTQRPNVRHFRRYGNERGANDRALVQIQQDYPQVPHEDSSDEPVKCFKCDKQFKDKEFLKKHMLTAHPAPSEEKRRFCDECGDVVRFIDFAKHRNACLSINTRGSEAQGSSRNADDSVNGSPFTPPVTKKSREDILHEKNEQRNTSFTELRAPRANTQMVIRNLSYSFDKRQSPMTPSPLVAHDTDDCAHSTTTPRGTIISATSLGDDRIEKLSHPLILGIYVCPQKNPNEFMVVWSVSLEEDLLQAMSEVPDKAILCVQKVNMEDLFNLNNKQKELLSRSQKVTFNMLDDNNVCKQWTVISFGNIPSGLEDQLFRSFADVEKIFEEHARRRGKTLNNIMRCDGLFPLLSQQLQKKITGFNQ